jgi:hypothetical protein
VAGEFVVRWSAPDGSSGLCLADGQNVAVMSRERADEYATGMTSTSSTGTRFGVHPLAEMAAAPDLLEALDHMQFCRACGEGDWADCDGGRAALAAIAKATGEGA